MIFIEYKKLNNYIITEKCIKSNNAIPYDIINNNIFNVLSNWNGLV